jgi:ATP-binding cassette subfamily B protein
MRRSVVLRILRLADPASRRGVALGIVFRFLQAICLGVPVGLLVRVIEELRQDTLSAGDAWLYSAITAASLLGQVGFGYLSSRCCWLNAYRMGGELQLRVLDHLRRVPMGFHTGRQAGDVAAALSSDVTMVKTFVSNALPLMVGAVGLPIAVFAVLLAVDPWMALATVATIPLALPLFVLTNRIFSGLATKRQRLQGAATARIVEYVQGLAVVRAFNLAGARLAAFQRSLDDFRAVNAKLAVQIVPLALSFVTVVELGMPVLLAAGTYWLGTGRIDAGTLLVFLVLSLRVYGPLLQAAEQAELLRIADAALARIEEILEVPALPEPRRTLVPGDASVAFEGVRFGYGREGLALRHVSFTAAPGSMTALVGPSGSGKTTVLSLISRFWDPQRGRVRLGGVDLREIAAEDLYRRVTVVFQDVYLFQGTIFGNIAFGRPEASRAEVEAAARAACCHDFIAALPLGYDTPVGEAGATLSGGERQRVSIARAILKDAPIVLLDEATASIDPTNERLVQQALSRLVAGKTLIVVAHRLSTIAGADQILFLEDGEIVERGDHARLLAAGGRYAAFWKERERAAGWRVAGV